MPALGLAYVQTSKEIKPADKYLRGGSMIRIRIHRLLKKLYKGGQYAPSLNGSTIENLNQGIHHPPKSFRALPMVIYISA
jgi:hypothetical protein